MHRNHGGLGKLNRGFGDGLGQNSRLGRRQIHAGLLQPACMDADKAVFARHGTALRIFQAVTAVCCFPFDIP